MKQKKLVHYFLILSISLTLFLPVINLFFTYKYNHIKWQHFSKEHLFSTDNFESIINYIVYKAFDFSLNEPNVIVGKDNFFFLGNIHSRVIDKTRGTFPYTQKDIFNWASKIKTLQNWYEEQGIKFLIVIASNKHTIYHDKLPKHITYSKTGTLTDDIVQYARSQGVHILNLKEILREKKDDAQLYFYTDTHWTNYGALLGYISTMKYLNNIYTQNYEQPQYTITLGHTSGNGDLTKFLRINRYMGDTYETEYMLNFKSNPQLCYGIIDTKNTLQRCTSGNKNKFNQYTINTHAPNKKKLLYLCDSFGLANSQLYSQTFHTVWRLHISYTKGSMLAKFIQKNKPDIVIYQVVERDFGNNTILDDMPYIPSLE